MSRILQALKQLEAQTPAPEPGAVAPPGPAAVAAAAAPVVAAPVAETPVTPPATPAVRQVTELITPRRKRRKVRRAPEPPSSDTAAAALETAADIERLLAAVAPGVIECWTTRTAETESFVGPTHELSASTPALPQVVLQDNLPTVIEVPAPMPSAPPRAAAVESIDTPAALLEAGETEVEVDFRPAKPRRVKRKAAKAKRATPAPDVRELQVRSAVRGARVTGVTRPSAWETTIRADLEDASLVLPFERLLERWRQDRGDAATASLLIASLGAPLAAAEIALRAGVLLAQRDDASVLVVDGDSAGALSRRLGITGKPGLSELLAPQDAHGETIYPTATARLHILPRGRRPWPIDADAAGMAKVLGELAHDYTWILVAAGDTTSAPAAALARACRGTYAVAPLGETDLATAQEQLAALHAAGARVFGAIAVDTNAECRMRNAE